MYDKVIPLHTYINIPLHYGLLQVIKYSSLCYTVRPCLSILYVLVCICAVLCLVTQSCLTLCDPMRCSLPAFCLWEFPRQEYWSGLPCPPAGIFPNRGSNLGLPHCRQILYRVSHQGCPSSQSIPPTLCPPWPPQISFLCLWLCFCFPNKFICVIFSLPHISDIMWYLCF